VGDEQTHDLPSSPKGVARIAAFCGQTEPAFRADLLERLARTDVLTDGFFVPRAQADAPEMSATASKTVEGWFSYPCLRSERAQAIFRRLKPGLLKSLEGAHNPEQALIALDQFFSGLPSGVQIFSLFEANPPLVDLIVDIAATAPALAQYLSRNASVLDAVIGGSFFAPWPERHVLVQELSSQLSDLYDYESKLDRARRWTKEWHFRIGVHHLRGLIDGFEAAKQYADLACAVITAIWGCVVAEFSAKHGPLPGRGAVVLGMGSLGAGRLNSGSDLDLILIYDASDIEASVGPKPLVSRSYYARLTQTFVTALSARMAEGRLYEVDVRLRPSGRQGPVATSISAFRDYQMNEAWTWEHLALTRARVLVGHPVLAAEVEAFRRQVLGTKGKAARVIADLCDMRVRLAAAKPGQGALEAKFGAGKLMDIELLAQMLALISANPAVEVERQLLSGGTRAKLSVSEQTILLKAYTLFWKLQIAKRLLSNDQLTVERLGDGGEKFLLRETGTSSMQELTDTLVTFQRQVETVLATQLKG
jgi:glutamate-ammonia-ligase adenylyltransferase